MALALHSILKISTDERPVTEMRVVGGGSTSAIWRQIIADILQLNLLELNVPSSAVAALGAAIAAGVGSGIFVDYDTAAQVIHPTRVTEFEPAAKKQYVKNISLYQELYPRLKDLYLL